jgi:hypothetical protein
MPDDEFAEAGGHRSQFVVAAASAAGVLLVVAAAVGVHSWRNGAVQGPAADETAAATALSSLYASSVSSGAAVSASEPAFSSAPGFSSAPAVSLAPTSSPSLTPSPHSSATIRHTSPVAPAATDESKLNFVVKMRLSPTHVMLGQPTHVTVTILNAGTGLDPPADVSVGSMVPADDFSDAPSDCTVGNGGVDCPISRLRAGGEQTITFTVTTGYYPGDSWDDEIYGQLNYADSYGQPQQLQPGYSADLLVDAGTPSSAPPTSAAPSTAPSPPTSAAPKAATPTPSPTGQ